MEPEGKVKMSSDEKKLLLHIAQGKLLIDLDSIPLKQKDIQENTRLIPLTKYVQKNNLVSQLISREIGDKPPSLLGKRKREN